MDRFLTKLIHQYGIEQRLQRRNWKNKSMNESVRDVDNIEF